MIIKTQIELDELCADLSRCPYITIDTEFLREKTFYPKLCLIQVSTPEKRAAAIDPLEGDFDLKPLFDVLLDERVLKVFHAGRQDLEIFYNLMGKVVTPFFDTQIAAMVCGYGDSVGYESLVRNITGESLDKSVQFTNWSNRPLSKKQIDYALGDVLYLVDIYEHLAAELDKRGRTNWVFQEEEILSNPATYENQPENAWERIKLRSPKPRMLAILRELAAWRELKAQERDIPRTWIMRDETLADMAAQAPANAEQLSKIRNVSEDMAKGSTGQILLDIIKKAQNSDKKTWPQIERKQALPPSVSGTVDILKMLLKIECAEHGVATKLVASVEDLEAIAMSDNADVPAMQGWRYDIFGKDAVALKQGKLAIGLKGSRITKYKVSGESEEHQRER